jgi:hypothetical protein
MLHRLFIGPAPILLRFYRLFRKFSNPGLDDFDVRLGQCLAHRHLRRHLTLQHLDQRTKFRMAADHCDAVLLPAGDDCVQARDAKVAGFCLRGVASIAIGGEDALSGLRVGRGAGAEQRRRSYDEEREDKACRSIHAVSSQNFNRECAAFRVASCDENRTGKRLFRNVKRLAENVLLCRTGSPP